MTEAGAIQIADSVVAELDNGVTNEVFSQEFTPQTNLLPIYELSELQTLKVDVMPLPFEQANEARALTKYDYQIDIGIQKKVSDIDSETRELCKLVEEISEYIKKRVLSTATFASWVKTINDPLYSVDLLYNQKVFQSVLTITYRAIA